MIVTTITNSSCHQLAQVQVGATNYMETDSNIVMAATSHQRQMGAGQLARSICRQHYNAQVTTPAAPATSHQIQANQNQWPTVVDGGGNGQWSSSHKFHMNQEQNYGQKPTNEDSLYDYFQVKFSTPTTNHYLENSRLVAGARTDEFTTQQHPYQSTTNHHHHHHHDPNHHYDHYYNSAAANQVQVSYNVANVYSSNLSYPPDAVRDRYQQQISTYHDNQAYNGTAPQPSTATSVTSSKTCQPSTSLYHGQQNHQNFPSPIKAQAAATNRVSFGEMNSKCRPINIAEQSDAVWVSHTQYHDYGLTPLVGHNKEVDSVQIPDQAHNWPTKVAFAPVRAQPECQDLTNGYDYYRTECRTDQTAFDMNSADPTTTAACDHQILQKVSSSSPSTSSYQSNASKRSILATGNGLELKQVTANRSFMEEKHEPLPMFQEVSVIQSCKPVGAQLEKQPAKTIQFELKNKIPSGPAATSKNQPTHTDRLNQCRICGRHYARPSTLKTHLRTHTNERPYKCAVCRKTFSQAANLTAHQRVHTGERPFPCPICGRQFSQSSSVITHLRTHSGERPYRCNMCNRTFSDSSTLTKHCRIHSGEKPYQCDHCPMNFSQSGNLSRHLRLHSIGISSNKTHLATATTTTTAVAANVAQNSNVVAVSAPSKTPTAIQRNHSNNPSSSPDSTLSNYSIYSRVSSAVDNLTDAPRSGLCELANCK